MPDYLVTHSRELQSMRPTPHFPGSRSMNLGHIEVHCFNFSVNAFVTLLRTNPRLGKVDFLHMQCPPPVTSALCFYQIK